MPSFACVFYLAVTSQAFWALGAANAKDSTRLVRKSVSAWQTFQFEKPQMGAKVQDVLREFQDLARVGVSPEPEKIRTIKSIVDDELLPDLQAVHDAAAKQVGINLAAIDQCNKNALGRLEEVKGTTEVSVGKERTDHATCREEEKNKNNTKGDKCAELDNFLAGVNVPADLPAGRARDEMVAYVKTMSVYFCHKGPDVTDLDDACDKATAEHAKHKAACDKLQAVFELGFCTWRTELIDTCAALSTCYASATKIYNGHVSDTKELVKKWKVEYGALKKILCYVEVWLSDNNVKTANADQLQKCESSNIDTSPMDIDFGTPAKQAQCPLTAVEKYPGTQGFVTTEYANFKDYVVEVIPCLPTTEQPVTAAATTAGPATTTVGPVTAAPTPTPRIEQHSVHFAKWKGGIKCEWITFKEAFEKAPFVQVTVDHRTHTKNWDHDAVTVWVQEVYKDRFRACVRELAQFGNGAHDSNLHVSYMAFEGAPQGAVIGNASWSAYKTDYKCEWIEYGQKFPNADDVRVVTTIYHQPNKGGNAITEWAQEVEADRFRACVRETQHHDQQHMSLNMAYMAWSQPIPGMVDGRTEFKGWSGGTKCQQIEFEKPFTAAPVVQATIDHRHKTGVTHHAITIWLEKVYPTGFDACVRELAMHGSGAHDKLYVDWLAREE